jgi:hypothetical protein
MAVKLLKELMSERLDRLATIKYPSDVQVSYCKQKTNSVTEVTRHGAVKRYVVTEV